MATDPVVAQIERMYGVRSLPRAAGVLHVAAVWDGPRGWVVMRIGDASPSSDADLFALALARARADVIVTTGQILRDEPDLVYDLPGALGAELKVWRAQAQGRANPPVVVVLSGSGDIDPDHPTLRSWAPAVVLTNSEGAARARAAGVAVPIHAVEGLSPRTAVTWARTHFGADTVTVEAGARTTTALYEAPCLVDELMLSVFTGPNLAEAARGRPFVAARADALPLRPLHPASTVVEPSGTWKFVRMSREQTDPAGRPFNRTGDEGNARHS